MPIEPTPVAPVTSIRSPRSIRIPVLLVDDHPAVRVGARKLIDDQPDMAVVAEARSAEEALRQSEFPIDVAVVDYQLGERPRRAVAHRAAQAAATSLPACSSTRPSRTVPWPCWP